MDSSGFFNEKQTEINGILRLVGSPNCKHSGKLICKKKSSYSVCLNISRPASVPFSLPLCQRSSHLSHSDWFRFWEKNRRNALIYGALYIITKQKHDKIFYRSDLAVGLIRKLKEKQRPGRLCRDGNKEKFIGFSKYSPVRMGIYCIHKRDSEHILAE